MSRAVTVRESEFSFMDRVWLLDSRAQESVQRGSHGIPIEEATDPANRGKFVVPLPTTDFAAKALNDMQKAYRDAYGDRAGMDHLLWRVEKVD